MFSNFNENHNKIIKAKSISEGFSKNLLKQKISHLQFH